MVIRMQATTQDNGPNHLGCWVTWAAIQCNGPNHLGFWVTWAAVQDNGLNYLGFWVNQVSRLEADIAAVVVRAESSVRVPSRGTEEMNNPAAALKR